MSIKENSIIYYYGTINHRATKTQHQNLRKSIKYDLPMMIGLLKNINERW